MENPVPPWASFTADWPRLSPPLTPSHLSVVMQQCGQHVSPPGAFPHGSPVRGGLEVCLTSSSMVLASRPRSV